MNALITAPVLLAAALNVAPGADHQTMAPAAPVAVIQASGMFHQTAIASIDTRKKGRITLIHQTSKGNVLGTIDGTFDDDLHVRILPNDRFTAKFTLTVDCVIGGRSGTVTFRAADVGRVVGPTTGKFAGVAVVTDATGELAGMKGVLRIKGTVDLVTGLSSYSYKGRLRLP